MSLNPTFTYGSLDLTAAPFAVEFGTDLGAPESVTQIMASLLADGEIESETRRSNRTIVLPILIDDSDLLALAEAEAALSVEADRERNTLTIDPGDGAAPVTVFDTFRGRAAFNRDDDEEVAGFRRWTLTLRALPHGRSATKVVDSAGTPPSSGTVVNSCESTAGWATTSASPSEYVVDSTTFAEGSGSIRSKSQTNLYIDYDDSRTYYNYDKVSGLSVSTGAGGYLSFAVRGQFSNWQLLQVFMTSATGGRQQVSNYVAAKRDANGFVHYVFPVAAGLTVTAMEFASSQNQKPIGSTNVYVWYDDFELMSAATTDHQIVKQHNVRGSARTTGSLHIAAPSDSVALGQVLAITTPTAELQPGFQPDGRRWVTQGTTTTDSTALWGSYFTPATSYSSAAGYPIFDVPVGMLTAGPYTMVALVKAESSPTVAGVQAQLRVGSTNVGPLSVAEVSLPNLTAGWQFVTLGTCYLPPLPVQSADVSTKVRLLFKGAKIADVYMVPAWQVGGRTVADFSIVDCGSGTVAAGGPSSNLWIDSPSVDQPQGGWWRGPTADRLNTQSAWPDAKKPGVHTFPPGLLTNFVISTGAAGPTSTLEYYPAWFGSAAS